MANKNRRKRKDKNKQATNQPKQVHQKQTEAKPTVDDTESVIINEILAAIFPDDYCSDDAEPAGTAVAPNPMRVPIQRATPQFETAAKNLKTMIDIHADLLHLGLSEEAANGICHVVRDMIQEAAGQAAMSQAMMTGRCATVSYENNDKKPFGLTIYGTGVGYSQQLIADVKETMRIALVSTQENNPEFFSTNEATAALDEGPKQP